MQNVWQEYFTLLEEISRSLEELTALEKQKTQAVLHDDLLGVDECMKREQALSMSLHAQERSRVKVLAALNLSGTSLSALAGYAPPELRVQAQEAAADLRGCYERYQAAADVARNTLECNLHQIEKIIEQRWGSEVLADAGARRSPGGTLTDFRA